MTEAAPYSRLTLETPKDLSGTVAVTVAGLDAEIVEVSGKLVDFVVPANTLVGEAAIDVSWSGASPLRGTIRIADVSPALFTARPRGPLAVVLRSTGAEAVEEAAYNCDEAACQAVPIDLGPETDSVMLRVALSGTRSQTGTDAYAATIGDTEAVVMAVEQASGQPGVDWVTISIPRSLAGRGEAGVALTVGGKRSNELRVLIQ